MYMNSGVYSRLFSLFDTVGLSGAEGSRDRAELKAYAAAVSAALGRAEQALSEVFTDTMGKEGILMYCDLLNMDRGATQQETKENIIRRLSEGFFFMSRQEFREKEIGTPGYHYTVENLQEKVHVSPVNQETLAAFSDLYNNDYPAFFAPQFTGAGLTFDFLDSLDYRWFESDRLELPFSVWEKIGGEAEQTASAG